MKEIKYQSAGPDHYKKKLFFLFMLSFIGAVLVCNLFIRKDAYEAGILSEYFLKKFQYLDIDFSRLFFYVLEKRFKIICLLAVAGITMFGIWTAYAYTIWIGFSVGMMLSLVTIELGIKGIFVCIGAIVPQYILYIPCIILFLGKVYRMSCELYYQGGALSVNKKQLYFEYVLGILILTFLILAGCFLESFVNPYCLKKMLDFIS